MCPDIPLGLDRTKKKKGMEGLIEAVKLLENLEGCLNNAMLRKPLIYTGSLQLTFGRY